MTKEKKIRIIWIKQLALDALKTLPIWNKKQTRKAWQLEDQISDLLKTI